jgi:hypothetical protein
MKPCNKRCVLRTLEWTVLTFLILFSTGIKAQTPGVIYDRSTSTAGRLVLDRNGDGYTSATTAGFTSNDVTQSEMIFTPIPQISVEPNGDVVTAPSCGFTDFTDNSITSDAVGVHLDSNNTYLVFRFRMSNTSSNSKGYSVLIDADGKFGNTGPYADPNYVAPTSSSFGNPGFEIEVLLATNFGVYVYNVDGTANPTTASTTYSGHSNYQKSVAYNTNCTQAYFLDFYVKVSDLPSPYNNLTTGFRYAANTVTSPRSALLGPISDVGGVNDASFGDNYTSIWSNVITAQASTSLTNLSSMKSILQPPTVLSPIYNTSSSIRVTNNDLASGYLTIYKQHSGVTSRLGITSLTASGATATLSAITVATGDIVWATDSVSGATVSLNSNTVTVVAGSTCNKPTAPLVTCNTNRGMQGTSLYSGATIKIYSDQGRQIATVTGGTTLSGSTYTWAYDPTGGSSTSPCSSGNVSGNTVYGSYFVTVSNGGCESNYGTSGSRQQSGGSTTACTPPSAPTVSSCNSSTGTISGTSSIASDSIVILKNGTFFANTVANASKAWSYTGSFQGTDTILVAEYTGSNSCISTLVVALNPPVVSSPIYNGATTVSGTSTAPAGTYIKIYKTGSSQSLGSAIVSTSGTWSASVSALATGNVISAYDSLSGFKSSVSNSVTVVAQTTVTPTITGTSLVTYLENGTSVSGTLSASGSGTLTLYEDGTAIGTATVTSSASWTVTGLSSTKTTTLDNYLYAGGYLTAKFTATGLSEGPVSNTVQVGCNLASTAKTVLATKYKYCSSEYAAVTIANSENGVVYTMVNNGTATTISPSLAGTGSTITLTTSSLLSSSKIIQVTAMKVSPVSCAVTEADTAYLRQDCDAVYSTVSYASGHTFNQNDILATVSDADGSITAASINSGTLPPGISLNTSTGQIYVSDVNTFSSSGGGTWPLTINTTDNHTFLNSAGSTVNGTSSPAVTISIVNPLPVTLISFTGKQNGSVVNLNWVTVSEINNDYFEIERSIDGKDFYAIGTKAGHGTSNVTWDYTFTDEQPLYGTSFYRLKQVDFNGQYSYSNILPMNILLDANTKVKVYPNPLVKPNILHVEILTTQNEIVETSLSDIAGQVVSQNAPEVVSGLKTLDIDVKNIKQGFYYLRVQTPGNVIVQKIEILGQ